MNIPDFPTDNLYKFIAIFGLALMITAVVCDVSEWKGINTETSSLKESISILDAKTNLESGEASSTSTQIRSLVTPQDLEDDLESLARLTADASNLTSDYNLTLSESGNLAKLYYLGIALTFFGFLLWYLKLQRYLDAKIKREAEK